MNIQLNAECIAEFKTFNQWVNKGALWLGYNKRTHVLICLDSAGNICDIGEDFMAARDHGLFPVKAYLIEKTIMAVKQKS